MLKIIIKYKPFYAKRTEQDAEVKFSGTEVYVQNNQIRIGVDGMLRVEIPLNSIEEMSVLQEEQ
jgi:hypothetical protein